MNSYQPSKYRIAIASSSATPSVEALDAKITSLEMLRVRMASEEYRCSSPSTQLYKDKDKAQDQDTTAAAAAAANSIEGSDMQVLHIPTKSASCASGPATAIVGDGSGNGSCSSTTTLNESTAGISTANADSKEGGNDMHNVHTFIVPTKSEHCKPGPILNPRSCASGLDLLALVERMNDGVQQGNNRRRNSSLQNEEWDWDDLRSPRVNLFLGNGEN